MGCAAILLTGGASRRMGRDKATLVVDGRTLAERTAQLIAVVASPCVEVGPGVSGLESIREDPPGGGPLLAVAAGIGVVGTTGPALVVACDLPRLDLAAMRWLVGHPSPRSVVPVVDGRAQPLCARWSPVALQAVDGLVAAGARAMRDLVAGTDAELVVAPPGVAGALEDVDTPEQLRGVTGLDSS